MFKRFDHFVRRKPPLVEIISSEHMSDADCKKVVLVVRSAACLFVGTLRDAGADVCYYIRRKLDEVMPSARLPYRRRRFWSVVGAHALVADTSHDSSILVRMGNMFFLCTLN